MNYTGLGNRVRSQRRRLHWTQEKLAEKAGISISFLGHIERGTRKASIETLVSIANAMCVSPALLLQDSLSTEVYNPASTSQRQRELIREISKVILDSYNQ